MGRIKYGISFVKGTIGVFKWLLKRDFEDLGDKKFWKLLGSVIVFMALFVFSFFMHSLIFGG